MPGPGGVAQAPPAAAARALAEAEVGAVLAALKKAARVEGDAARAAALRAAVPGVHAKVAEQLLHVLAHEPGGEAQAACLALLGAQAAASAKVAPAVLRWLDGEAAAEEERRARGDPGFLLDPRTHDPVLETPEGQQALERLAARGMAWGEGLRLAAALAGERPAGIAAWDVFLHHPRDATVVEALRLLGRWKVREALPTLLHLYRCYPTPASWETGGVVDIVGDNATAKRTWQMVFGHPDKQRARPQVVAALEQALQDITGEAFRAPEDLEAWLKRQAAAAGKGGAKGNPKPAKDSRRG
ncbi:MAG: hypothetical protein ACKOSS_01015 [Planctomycetia bacterium]